MADTPHRICTNLTHEILSDLLEISFRLEINAGNSVYSHLLVLEGTPEQRAQAIQAIKEYNIG